MTTTTQVFLNTSRDGYAGFVNDYSPPSVRLALKFELPDTITHQYVQGMPVHALEHVFQQLNGVVPAAYYGWTMQYRHNGNRSLSVGDVVVVGETAFAVEDDGWLRITTDQLLDAILSDRMVGVR